MPAKGQQTPATLICGKCDFLLQRAPPCLTGGRLPCPRSCANADAAPSATVVPRRHRRMVHGHWPVSAPSSAGAEWRPPSITEARLAGSVTPGVSSVEGPVAACVGSEGGGIETIELDPPPHQLPVATELAGD